MWNNKYIIAYCFLFQSLGKLLKNARAHGKSQDSISEEPAMSSDERESQAGSVSAGLDWSMISSDSGTEGMFLLTHWYI